MRLARLLVLYLISLYGLVFGNIDQKIGVICFIKNECDFFNNRDLLNLDQVSQNEIVILCEELEGDFKKFGNITLGALSNFQAVIRRFDRLLITKLDQLFTYINLNLNTYINWQQNLRKVIHIAKIDTDIDITKFDCLKKLTYETIYPADILIAHFNGKGSPNIYIVEVFLQACIYYSGIYSNEMP